MKANQKAKLNVMSPEERAKQREQRQEKRLAYEREYRNKNRIKINAYSNEYRKRKRIQSESHRQEVSS